MAWSLDPLQLAPLALVGVMYAVRARTLNRRGTPVPRRRVTLFSLGIAMAVVALASPVEAYAEELFAFHMVQHVLLGDLVPLALVAGLSGPLLRPLLSISVVERLRVLSHPVVALPLWAANLAAWHVPFLHEAAVRHDAVHALQHVSFLGAGMLMWEPVVEVLPGPMWFGTAAKLGYVVAVRLYETVVANILFWAGAPLYGVYALGDGPFGLSAEADQAVAGAVMMIEGSLVTIGAIAWLFLRLAAEGELRQQLLERGHDPGAVRRAVRYGRGQELSEPR